MKKIMFNDKYGLTQAVLEGRKTMTRRIMMPPKKFKGKTDLMLEYHNRLSGNFFYDCVVCDADGHELGQMPLPYEVGDVVAIAQRYEVCWDYYQNQWKAMNDPSDWHTPDAILGDSVQETPGWKNKMFVRADLMPWQIVIEDLWFERLQDISDADIMREGIMEGEFMNTWDKFYYDHWGDMPNHITFPTARKAFSSLINHISGSGTWESNPWVVAYSFRLQRAHGFQE